MINKLFRRAACQCSPAAEGGQGVQTPAPRLSSMGGGCPPLPSPGLLENWELDYWYRNTLS